MTEVYFILWDEIALPCVPMRELKIGKPASFFTTAIFPEFRGTKIAIVLKHFLRIEKTTFFHDTNICDRNFVDNIIYVSFNVESHFCDIWGPKIWGADVDVWVIDLLMRSETWIRDMTIPDPGTRSCRHYLSTNIHKHPSNTQPSTPLTIHWFLRFHLISRFHFNFFISTNEINIRFGKLFCFARIPFWQLWS